MRAWQIERRRRTRHLIELGGLIVKARLVDMTGDDRAIIFGALLWMADIIRTPCRASVRRIPTPTKRAKMPDRSCATDSKHR
jgi:conjugative transfer protein TraD